MQNRIRGGEMKIRKLLLMSVFVSLFVITGVNASFAEDYHDYGRKDYYTKDGKYDNNNFKSQSYKYNGGYKYYKGNNNRYYAYRKQYLKNNRYVYGYRHSHNNDFGTHYI